MVQVGVRLLRELVLCQKREHVDVRQIVVLRLFDGTRDDATGVVDEPVNKKLVECLLHLDKHRLAGLRGAVDVKDGSLVIQYTRVFRNTESICLDSLVTGEAEHGVQELHGTLRLGLVRHEHLEDAVTERVNVLVLLAVFRQVFGMFVHILDHGDKFLSCHFLLRKLRERARVADREGSRLCIRRFFGAKYA